MGGAVEPGRLLSLIFLVGLPEARGVLIQDLTLGPPDRRHAFLLGSRGQCRNFRGVLDIGATNVELVRLGFGVEVDQRFFQALRFRDGNVLWWGSFPSKADALKAVGLED